jgi:site-specific recombinase XerD
MSTAELYDEFCRYIEAKYNSIHTQRAYIGDVGEFIRSSSSLDRNACDNYLRVLHKKGISNRTIKRKLSSLAAFFRFLKSRGIVYENPVDFMEKPKSEKNLPAFLDVDDVLNLLEKIENKRDRALLELIYSSSLRASEAVSLNIEDVDFENLRIRIKRKGSKIAYIPITSRAKRFLQIYIQDRSRGAVFLNRYNQRLSTRSLQKIVKKYALNNIFKDISPHALRHSKATHLLNSGMDIRILQKFLGHSSIRATQIYTHLNLSELAKTYDKTHPLAKDEKE